jgi:uncharacterized protein (DUF58 family)
VPTGRGVVVFAAGLGLWLLARATGSPTVHMLAVGVVVLPIAAAALARWGRLRLRVRRRVSDARVRPGQRVSVELLVENLSAVPASFVLLEDRLPPALGRPARLVLAGLRPRATHRVAYTLVPQRRGRFVLGPVRLEVSDPFALTRMGMELDVRDELVVAPEVEDLAGGPDTPFGLTMGLAAARQLYRSGDEFYTMRPYVQGDDLRRIHWPSVARTGELMIRQDESTRRSSAVLFVDTREVALGRSYAPAFEKAVSAAASVGVLLARYGFTLKVATSQLPPRQVSEDLLLEALAAVTHHTSRSLGQGLVRLRRAAGADATLVVVTAPPIGPELASLVQAGALFGPKLAVLVHPADPDRLPPEHRRELEGRATQALRSLSRSGWEVVVVPPSGRLAERWHAPRTRSLAVTG